MTENAKRGLEDLVPPPELCKRIPEGAFADSALVLARLFTGHTLVVPREAAAENGWDITAPAPTLQEIMVELARTRTLISVTAPISGGWQVYGWKTQVEEDRNPATAALKLWLDLNEEKKNA